MTPAPLELPEADPDRYAIGHEHARGGLGRVLAATDRVLDRPVAIKELLVADGAGASQFVGEALLTARLQHPAIVPIYDAGRWPGGEPFYAMKLVAGGTLKEAIAAAPTLDRRLALLPHVLTVADAIAYAHQHGIVHRDLKPSNIVLGEFGETVVIDWGLATRVDDASAQQPGAGTPAYMPPEQARGEATDRRGDVYALGAILYHLLVGRAPYTGERDDALAAVLAGPPRPIRVLEPATPRDLASIAERAMARDPAQRYDDARALSEDLRRFETGQLVGSHHYSRPALIGRWLRRHRVPVALSVLFATALAVVAVLAVLRVARARRAADERRDGLVLIQARQAMERDPTVALAWLAALPADHDFAQQRALFEQARGRAALAVFHHSLRGTSSVTATGHVLVLRDDGRLVDFDPRTREQHVRDLGPLPLPLCTDVSHAGDRIGVLEQNELIVLDLAHGSRHTIAFPPGIATRFDWCFFSADDRVFGFGAATGLGVAHVDRDTVEVLADDRADDTAIAYAATGDGAAIAWLSRYASAVHVVERGTRVDRETHGRPSYVTFTGDGAWLAVTTREGQVLAWSRDGARTRELTPCTPGTSQIQPLADAVVVHCSSGRIVRVDFERDRVVDLGIGLRAGGWLGAPCGHELVFDHRTGGTTILGDGASAVVPYDDEPADGFCAPDGAYFTVSSIASNDVRVYATPALDAGAAPPSYAALVGARWLAFSPDQRRLGFAGSAGGGWIDVADRTVHAAVTGGAIGGAWTPDGALALVDDHGIAVFDPGGGSRVVVREGGVTAVAFSRDGKWLAWTRDGGEIELDARTGGAHRLASIHAAMSIAFDDDNQLRIAGFETIWQWDPARALPDLVDASADRDQFVTAIDSHRGAIASATSDRAVHVFDATGDHVLATDLGELRGLAFSSDGRMLAAAGDDAVMLWDLATGDVHYLRGARGASALAFTPDGRALVVASDHATVWDLSRLPPAITNPAELRAAIAAETTIALDASDHPATQVHESESVRMSP